MGVTGIEPVTPSMSTKCSPAELYARISVLLLFRQYSCLRRIKGFGVVFKGFCDSKRLQLVLNQNSSQGGKIFDVMFTKVNWKRLTCRAMLFS